MTLAHELVPFQTPRCEDVMTYYFSKTLPPGFEDAVRRTTDALKQEGFGIISEIRRHGNLPQEARDRVSQLPHPWGLQPKACP